MLGGPRGVQHPDPAPRLVAIDLLGAIVAQLWRGAAAADADAEHLHALLDSTVQRADVEKAMSPQRAAGAGARAMLVQQALLGHLGALHQERGGLLEPASSALMHVVSRLCAEDAMVVEKVSCCTGGEYALYVVHARCRMMYAPHPCTLCPHAGLQRGG